MIDKEMIARLINEAMKARRTSYSPYSGFGVGACLLTEDGKLYTGCNIENAAFGPSNCAERTAFFKAVSDGARSFAAIAVVGGANDNAPKEYITPCGVCRQVMAEFCVPSAFEIIMAKSAENYYIKTLQELLPDSFGPADLGCERKNK